MLLVNIAVLTAVVNCELSKQFEWSQLSRYPPKTIRIEPVYYTDEVKTNSTVNLEKL
jgi:hypothetical protein